MKVFTYKKMPGIAELWDDCIYNLVYDTKKYTKEIVGLFNKLGINKQSPILDSSAGSGFPDFELEKEGYNIQPMDFSDAEIKVFKRKAKLFKSKLKCKKLSWFDIPKVYKKESFDFIFNRGNSFIYASGGWEEKKGKTKNSVALANYKKVLKIFYDSLRSEGWVYIDKFKDNEKKSKELVGKVVVGKENYNWYFYRNPNREDKVRDAKMIFENRGGTKPIVEFRTYLLTFKEMINIMKKIGFRNIKKIRLSSEVDFDILIAQK
jgi:hypothetical protein